MGVHVALADVCLLTGCSAMLCCVQGVQSGSWCVVNPGMTMPGFKGGFLHITAYDNITPAATTRQEAAATKRYSIKKSKI